MKAHKLFHDTNMRLQMLFRSTADMIYSLVGDFIEKHDLLCPGVRKHKLLLPAAASRGRKHVTALTSTKLK